MCGHPEGEHASEGCPCGCTIFEEFTEDWGVERYPAVGYHWRAKEHKSFNELPEITRRVG